jgi:predicted HTH transcriptional regulator
MSEKITANNLYAFLADGERINLECKKAQNSLPNSFWETYSAFANTNGGIILLGVSENVQQKTFEVCGVENAEKIIKNIWNTVNNPEKVNVNLLKNNNIQVLSVDGKSIVAIDVPRAGYNVRPVFINNNLSRGTYKRNHEGDYHCTESELRMLIRDANEQGNDRMILENYTMDDIDIPTLEKYRVMFRTNNPGHIWNELEHKDFLRQLGGYSEDRKEHIEGLTIAGLLMFGKGLVIRDRFDNLRLDYIDKSNLIGDQRYSDRLTYDGTWENNLFNFIRIVIPRLTNDLPKPFKMEGIIRTDDTLQHKAVREAVTNAVIHSDFMLNGVLKIEKYDDRFVLSNPGLLKLPIEQIYRGGESKSRNQRIQSMLRMIGYGENIGSGFPLILNAWDEKHWLKPELIEQTDLLQVKLTLQIEKLLVPNDGTNNGTLINTIELTERQRLIFNYIVTDSTITVNSLAQKTGISERTIKRELAELQRLKILSREGSRREGHWVVQI